MNNTEVMFIDLSGSEIKYEDISSHIGIAYKYVSENSILLNEFKKSKFSETFRYDLFLICECGYMSASNDSVFGLRLICNSEGLTKPQEDILKNYMIAGANITYLENENSRTKQYQKTNKPQ